MGDNRKLHVVLKSHERLGEKFSRVYTEEFRAIMYRFD